MNKFVIIVEDATKTQRDAFTSWLKESPYGFWHYITTMWIVADSKGEMDATSWREKAHEFMPNATIISLQLEGVRDWACMAPEKSFGWLEKHMND